MYYEIFYVLWIFSYKSFFSRFLKINFIAMYRLNILCKSSCSGDTQKSNMQQYLLQIWRLYDCKSNATGLLHGYLLENVK